MESEVTVGSIFNPFDDTQAITFIEHSHASSWSEQIKDDASDTGNQVYTMVSLRVNSIGKSYTKQVETFLDFLSYMGGLLCLFAALISFLIRPLVQKFLQAQMLSNLYQVQRYG